MDNNLNEEQIANYSEQVATKLLRSFFSDKEKISGQEILNFCAIKQVNLFILKVLFQKWKQESSKLESPYFDYDHKEVVQATEIFKNTVSRHILVGEASFRPILTKAIADTLMLVCSPYHFYFGELSAALEQGISPVDGLEEIKKFTKVNTSILEGLISHLDQSTIDQKDLEASKILDQVVGGLTSSPDEIEGYIDSFSSYVPLDVNDIYLEMKEPTQEGEQAPSIEDVAEEPTAYTVAEESESTLNEALAAENQTSLADMHEQKKIESLSKGITLNQRFMFVNVLFDGDVAKFNNTVIEIDGLVSLEEAKHYMNTHFDHWNEESDEVEEFMGVVERRFL